MDRDSISRIEEWDSRPVAGGYAGLADLADAGFDGAVESGGTRLLMLNGRVVGVFDGTISAFEDGEATAYESPDSVLPLLFAMQELDGEVRGRYYTDDTPIAEVDETLTSGGFTGYLELTENVLSGDYYVVYYGGRSLSAAFVGNEGRVVTGEDAKELAADEVGIYEVRSLDLEVKDVPEPSGDAAAVDAEPADDGGESAVVPGEDDGGSAEAEVEADEDDGDAGADSGSAESPADEEDDEGGPGDGDEAIPDAEGDGQEPSGVEDEEDDEIDETPEPVADHARDDEAGGDESVVEEAEDAGIAGEEAGSTPDSPTASNAAGALDDGDEGAGSSADAGDGSQSAGSAGSPSPRPDPERNQADARFEEEARWREARTVPALDPEESEQVVDRRGSTPDAEGTVPDEPAASGRTATADVEAFKERVERLEAELEASERERRRLTERLEDVVDDRDEIEAERAALAERIESLEARIEQAETAAGTDPTDGPAQAATGGSAVDPETALNQTDLFVRYGSKGKATLETAHDGEAGADEVAENLRIETHSRFDAATATVGGQSFEAYLEGTIQYRFVSWLVEELLYELQETRNEAGLRALYDALPKLDRAEFNGTVVRQDEEGEEHRETFDVVCRDRMGKPLVVANINDSLDPATGDMMGRLVEDATAAGEVHGSLGAAFLVTASFFEPDALETAAAATRGGGFLSRDSKQSFVKLTRNGGYHLCLVEARGDDFHVAVPDL